jgi:hypothetical protein
MKNISICILSILFAGVSFGQGNLQFNKVKLVGSTSETVPTGKVWKIESAPLTVKNGIRVPPSFMIGSDTIIMGYDSYTTSILENVVSVKLEWSGNNSATSYSGGCNGYGLYPGLGANNIKINISGTGSGNNVFEETLGFSNIPNSNSSNFQSLGVQVISNQRNNSLSSWNLYFSPINSNITFGFEYTFRVTFLLSNGNAFSYVVSSSSYGCAPQQFLISGPSVATETRTRPQVTTNFPIWIPAGTSVKTISNIGKLSILEFNVTQ